MYTKCDLVTKLCLRKKRFAKGKVQEYTTGRHIKKFFLNCESLKHL